MEHLKRVLVESPILGYPDAEAEFILDVDASGCALGAVLSQQQGDREVVILYGSKTLSAAEKNYCVTKRELLSVVYFSDGA